MKLYKNHLIYDHRDCANLGHKPGNGGEDKQCIICEGGLSVCAICGEYEAGLDRPCTIILPYENKNTMKDASLLFAKVLERCSHSMDSKMLVAIVRMQERLRGK